MSIEAYGSNNELIDPRKVKTIKLRTYLFELGNQKEEMNDNKAVSKLSKIVKEVVDAYQED